MNRADTVTRRVVSEDSNFGASSSWNGWMKFSFGASSMKAICFRISAAVLKAKPPLAEEVSGHFKAIDFPDPVGPNRITQEF
jgi:hypothetical protein